MNLAPQRIHYLLSKIRFRKQIQSRIFDYEALRSRLVEIKRLRVLEFSALFEFQNILAADRQLDLRFSSYLVANLPEINDAVRLRRAFKDPPAQHSASGDCLPGNKIGFAVAVIITEQRKE